VHVFLHRSLDEFRAAVTPLYLRDPVVATVELALLNQHVAAADPLLLTVSAAGQLVGAALQTPPYPLLCSGLTAPGAPAAVVDTLARHRPDLPAVRGIRSAAVEFAQLWQFATGRTAVVNTEERLYRLATLRPPVGVSGAYRLATSTDDDVVNRWWFDFNTEAFGEPPLGPPRADPVVLWTVEGTAVSMAQVRRPAPATGAVSRIGPVFTPQRYRGHGYGSAATATAAAWARHAGATDVVLFTDLANPVSNAIYQRIGFEPVADSARIDFTPTT
jgi:RimJ/RimL family protein N-acetyltransferase